MGEGASQGSSWFLEKLVHGKKEERQAGRQKEVKVGVERRSSVTFSPLRWWYPPLFAFWFHPQPTWPFCQTNLRVCFVISKPESWFSFGVIFIFQCFLSPLRWSLCRQPLYGDVKKKKNGGVSNWKTCLNLFQTLSDSKPFWLPDQGILQGLKPWCR